MKAHEYRIGNIVMGNKPFSLKANDIALAYNHEKFKGEPRWKDVPLTEEWLLKFGFEKDEIGQLFLEPYIDDVEANIVFYLEGDEVVLRDSFEDIFLTRVHFIHQLQNLHHALTGKELKLKERQDA